jgi:hypothetical protein
VHIREREEPGGIFTDAFIQAESSVGVKLVLANLPKRYLLDLVHCCRSCLLWKVIR